MENKLYLKTLYPKLTSRSISDLELQWLLDYFATDNLEDLYQMIRLELDMPDEVTMLTSVTSKEQLAGAEVYSRIKQEISKESIQPSVIRLWPRMVAAAVAIIILSAGLYYYNVKDNTRHEQSLTQFANEVEPGKVGATLTLANGKKIRLADAANGELATEAGISITKTADGQIAYEIKAGSGETGMPNTLTTAKGEIYTLTLPDKSRVWMNSASSITYAAGLNEHGVRRVSLIGEAYFEVTKDKKHPFVVHTQNMELTVLGTHFNINTYAEEGFTKATLLEGSVRVASSNRNSHSDEKVTLKPKEQASISGREGIMVKEVDLNAVIAWKNGYFDFNEHLGSIMNKVAMWYDVEVEFENEALKQIVLQGEISRNRPLLEILNMMTYTGDVHFEIKGRRLIVKK